MLIIYAILVLATGLVIGYYAGKTKPERTKQTVQLDHDTLSYLIERDNELWELEKQERRQLRYICPKLKQLEAHGPVEQQYIYLN
jgi:hypothetical protein